MLCQDVGADTVRLRPSRLCILDDDPTSQACKHDNGINTATAACMGTHIPDRLRIVLSYKKQTFVYLIRISTQTRVKL